MRYVLLLIVVVLLVGCPNRQTVRDRMGPTYGQCMDGKENACFEFGSSQPSDSKDRISRSAIVAYQYGCLHGDQASCAEIGEIYGAGEYQVDRKRKDNALFSACDSGELQACVSIADELPRYRALPLYKKACEGEVAIACTRWAGILRQSWRMETHLQQALQLEEMGCKLGDPMGCYSAGQAYLFGSGVDVDVDAAQTFFDKSCNDLTGVGCRALGKIHQDGLGVRADMNKANQYYDLAERHKVVDKEQTRRSAYLLFVDACNYGDVLGCYNAGWFNAEGVEVQRNISTSRGFFERACNEGLTSACKKWKDIQPAAEGKVTRERTDRKSYEVDSKGNRIEIKP